MPLRPEPATSTSDGGTDGSFGMGASVQAARCRFVTITRSSQPGPHGRLACEPVLAAETPTTRARAPFAQHVLQRTVVLREHRVLFLPNPKAGCTSLLWLLAAAHGIT